jgi:hypothetical protein
VLPARLTGIFLFLKGIRVVVRRLCLLFYLLRGKDQDIIRA